MRAEILGKDNVNLDHYKVVQLSNRVQRDGSSCGIYCLKVIVINKGY